jgi:hypothetical protein
MSRTFSLVTAVLLAAIPLFAWGQETKKDAGAEELEKAWEEFGSVGEEHKQLARLAGEWKVETKSYYPDPEKPEISEGAANFRVLMGGRYLQQNFQGEVGGKQFRGLGLSGYDNAKKKYVGAWIDTMGTGIMTTEGEYDEKKHELIETGVSSGPTGPEKFKMVSRYLDNDKFTFEMYMVDAGGQETKMMEMTYTRQSEPKPKKKKAEN